MEQLLDALNKDEKWESISEKDLIVMIQKSEKKRHEIAKGKIRAYYGHSVPMKIAKEEKRATKGYCTTELLEDF